MVHIPGAAVLPKSRPGSGPVFLQDLHCSGSESHLLDDCEL